MKVLSSSGEVSDKTLEIRHLRSFVAFIKRAKPRPKRHTFWLFKLMPDEYYFNLLAKHKSYLEACGFIVTIDGSVIIEYNVNKKIHHYTTTTNGVFVFDEAEPLNATT